MTIRAALFLWSSILLAALCRAEIGIGDARDDVLRQLGKPTSIARRGDHEIFLYPKGGRIEFVNGKVADVKGPLPPPIAPPTPAPPTGGPSNEASTKESQPAIATLPTAVPAKKSPPPPKQQSAPSEEFNPAAMSEQLAKQVEKMDNAWSVASSERETVHSPLDEVPQFLTGLVMRFIFTVVALKLAFKYWEMDAFWKGVFLIAGIDVALHAILELLGPVTGGFTTMVGVENGIPGLVLIYTINRFCFNKRIQNAVITAAAVKLVVTLCYVFAGLAALNMVFG